MFLEEASCNGKRKRDIMLGTWNVRSLYIFRKWEGVVGTGRSWLRIGTGGRHCEYGNELSGSIKCGEFLD